MARCQVSPGAAKLYQPSVLEAPWWREFHLARILTRQRAGPLNHPSSSRNIKVPCMTVSRVGDAYLPGPVDVRQTSSWPLLGDAKSRPASIWSSARSTIITSYCAFPTAVFCPRAQYHGYHQSRRHRNPRAGISLSFKKPAAIRLTGSHGISSQMLAVSIPSTVKSEIDMTRATCREKLPRELQGTHHTTRISAASWTAETCSRCNRFGLSLHVLRPASFPSWSTIIPRVFSAAASQCTPVPSCSSASQ